MSKFKQITSFVLSKAFWYKFLAYFLLIVFLYIFRWFIWVFLLTFIFSYLFYSTSKFLKEKIDNFLKKDTKTNRFFKKLFSLNLIIVLVYVLFITTIAFIASDLIPKLITELSDLHKTIPFVADYVDDLLARLNELKNFNSELWTTFNSLTDSQDFWIFLEVLTKLKSFSIVFFKWVLALFLSFVFLLDRKKLKSYLWRIKESNFKFLYNEYKIIFDKVVKSFWVIIRAQASIALVNTVLTTIWLLVIWFINSGDVYPYLLTLVLIVFLAWFIPVLWTFISSIPIIIVWYISFPERWISIVLEITILIAIIHMVEAYFLNPKIVAKALSLPISLTFLILLLSEDLFWAAWLILWMSLFYFIVWLFSDIDTTMGKKKKKKLFWK